MATATVFKYSHEEWHEYSETAYWEEFAPLKEVWENNKPTGKYILDRSGQWGKMGRIMLMKCAEAQALRRGWPDDLSGLYVSEEMDQSKIIDITPNEQAERAEVQDRQAKLGGPSIGFDFLDGAGTTGVPVGQVYDRLAEWIDKASPQNVVLFSEQNRYGLREFWVQDKDAALSIKQKIEAAKNNQMAA